MRKKRMEHVVLITDELAYELEIEAREPIRLVLDGRNINKLMARIPSRYDVDASVDSNWDTPFAYCAYIGWEEGMRYLHSVGADVNKVDHDDCTVLMYREYPLSVVKLAVELGVNVRYRNCHYDTCLSVRQHCRCGYYNYCGLDFCCEKAAARDQTLAYLRDAWLKSTLRKSCDKLLRALEIIKNK